MASVQRFKAPLAVLLARLLGEPAARAIARELAGDLLERIPLPVCVVRAPGLRTELANHAFRQLTVDGRRAGRTLREALSTSWGDSLVRELDAALRTGAFRKAAAQADSSTQRCPDECYYDWLLCPLGGQPEGARLVGIVGYDVTAHIEARKRAQLAVRSAEQARNQDDEFLAQLAHELRSPLAPITAALELLRQTRDGELERGHIVIERQIEHLARLINDVVDLSKSKRRGLVLRRERVALAAVVERALELSAPLLTARGHGVHVDVAHDLFVEGDSGRLIQVIGNLVSNAAKYMADRGSIQITARRVQGEVDLSVVDTGIGIAREMLPRVFDRFVQAPDAQRRSPGGLGLGLHIAQTLVREHGGRIEAHSDGLGRGSTFRLRLPSVPSIDADFCSS